MSGEPMHLLAVGVDHTQAPLALRGRLALHGHQLDAALARLGARVPEAFILSTCNRTEAYALVEHPEAGAFVLSNVLAECGGLSMDALTDWLAVRHQEAAVAHLFAVAAGLRSMVTGEDQILAQLKAALAQADTAGTLGPVLHRLGAAALGVGKRVRTETEIGRHAVSVVSVALRQADLVAAGRVLVVGAGHTAELALKHLMHHAEGTGLQRVVVNRTEARARVLAAQYGATAASWDTLEDAAAAADVIVSATGATEPVIGHELITRVQRARGNAPLMLIDLAVPADIDPAVASVPGVTRRDLDYLGTICDANRALRQREIARGEAIVADHTARYFAWLAARRAAPAIAALVAQAAAMRDAEVERVFQQLPGLATREREIVRDMAARLVNKVLHAPLIALKEQHS